MSELQTIEARDLARVAESLVTKGDLSALSTEERTRYYVQMCEGLGLNPNAQPFALLRLNGKEVMYPTRGATDQLAAIHRLTREIIDGPKVIDVAGTKLVYAVCRATHPNGRIETAVATVPLVDPANALMRVETKAKRRATLSILGLGLLDESEVRDLPAGVSEPSRLALPGTAAPQLPAPADPLAALRDDVAQLGGALTDAEAWAIWQDHHAALDDDASERAMAYLTDHIAPGCRTAWATRTRAQGAEEAAVRRGEDPATAALHALAHEVSAARVSVPALVALAVKINAATSGGLPGADEICARSTLWDRYAEHWIAAIAAASTPKALQSVGHALGTLPDALKAAVKRRCTEPYLARHKALTPPPEEPPPEGAPPPRTKRGRYVAPDAPPGAPGDAPVSPTEPVAWTETTWTAHLAAMAHRNHIGNSMRKHARSWTDAERDRYGALAVQRLLALGEPEHVAELLVAGAVQVAQHSRPGPGRRAA